MHRRRGCKRRFIALAVALLSSLVFALPAAAGTPITLRESFAGNLDFVGTAGSLRSGTCGVLSSGSGSLSGIPNGATIEAAYLYWAKSGDAPDSSITLSTPAQSNLTVTADRSYTENYTSGANAFGFYSGVADVTAAVQSGGNGTYTVSNLNFDTGAPYSTISVCLGGWSLVVIYEDAGEPLRVVNLFEGFQNFRGSQITLVPDNFLVPASPINGRLGHITWEGDFGNSAELNNFEEQLQFEGTILSDPPDNPSDNQFNSVSNITTPTSTTEGVDFDSYVLGPPELFAGQTSADTVYSSGGDRVLLSAEIFATTNTPVADLALTKTDDGDFQLGSVEDWRFQVTNNGPNTEPGAIQVTDVLPAGTTYDSATGTGWSCADVSGTVTCTHPGPLAAGASLPDLSINVLVDGAAVPSVDNLASVSGTLFDNVSGNDTSSITTNVIHPDLSTSTKSVVDLNGGDADPGDVLRYTISVIETGGSAVSSAQVTDDLPANVTSFSVQSLPPGATDASQAAPAGASGSGLLDIQDISIPASGSVDVVFDVTIAAGTTPGTVISNVATVLLSGLSVATPAAPDLTVSASQIVTNGIKPLYFGSANATDPRALSRNAPNGLPPTGNLGSIRIDPGDTETWTLTEALAAPLALSGDNFPVALWVRGRTNGSSINTPVTVSVASTSLGTIASTTQTIALPATQTETFFTLNPGANLPATLPAGDVLTVTVSNGGAGNNQRFRVFPTVSGQGNSRVELNAATVIAVDSVTTFDAASPGGGLESSFDPGDPVSVRALVSDPFGAFDITSALVEIRDSTNATIVGPVAMSEIAAAETASTKTFEHVFTLSGSAALGPWTALVTANEGEEGTVSDQGSGTFEVGSAPDLVIFKVVSVLDDPVNGSTNPKAIPGANVMYTIGISNQGVGAVDADTIVIEDVLPSELEFFVSTFGNRGPFAFVDGTPASGLDVVFNSLADDLDDIEFDDGSGNWVLDPVADGEGFDTSVTAIRIRPSGALSGSGGTPPSFEVRFRARVKSQ